MRFGLFEEGATCPSGRYQLSFQGELVSKNESLALGTKGLEDWHFLKGTVEKIRPGQFVVVAQDLDFELAKKHMRKLIGLGIITYIEPMVSSLAFSRTFQ